MGASFKIWALTPEKPCTSLLEKLWTQRSKTQWHHLHCLVGEVNSAASASPLYAISTMCVSLSNRLTKQRSWQTLPVCCTSSWCRMWLSFNWFKWKPCVTYIATHQFLSEMPLTTIPRSCYRVEYYTTHALFIIHSHLIRKWLCLLSEAGLAITVWCSSWLLWDTMAKCRISPGGKFPFVCCLYIFWLNSQLK